MSHFNQFINKHFNHHQQQPHQDLQQGQPQQGKRVVGYFTNWGIYGRKYFPTDIPVQSLTHILYSFANLKPETGEVVLTDAWSDVEIHYAGDDWNDVGTNLYGNFKALYKLKQANRNLKILLSIGGWTYRENFKCLTDPGKRAEFARSAVRLVEDVGLDGLDVDWEYPENPQEAAAFVDLLRLLRGGLDQLSVSKGGRPRQYELSIAVSCGMDKMQVLNVREMDESLDFWNLMAYDFSGSWDSLANHASNLYSINSGLSADSAVRYYINQGVRPDKIVLGMPLYGKSFSNTNGIGQPFSGNLEGEFGGGSFEYRELPLPGGQVTNDDQAGASWMYDPSTHHLVSYDTLHIALLKVQYINSHGLGGAMFWELSNDLRMTSQDSIVPNVAGALGGGLEWRENELRFPGSKYDNLREGRI